MVTNVWWAIARWTAALSVALLAAVAGGAASAVMTFLSYGDPATPTPSARVAPTPSPTDIVLSASPIQPIPPVAVSGFTISPSAGVAPSPEVSPSGVVTVAPSRAITRVARPILRVRGHTSLG